jgi:hypothetical protein
MERVLLQGLVYLLPGAILFLLLGLVCLLESMGDHYKGIWHLAATALVISVPVCFVIDVLLYLKA